MYNTHNPFDINHHSVIKKNLPVSLPTRNHLLKIERGVAFQFQLVQLEEG